MTVAVREMEYKSFDLGEIKAADETGTFSGYASTYNRDLQNDRIQPGAFAQSIKDKRGMVPILMNHDDGRMIGATTSLAEDGKGLAMQGALALKSSGGADAYGLLQFAAASGFRLGMSIGFITKQFDWNEDDGSRLLTEIDLWEISLTPFPAQPKAFVQDVKTMREIESRLRDVGYSKTEAKRILRLVSDLNKSDGGTLAEPTLQRWIAASRSVHA